MSNDLAVWLRNRLDGVEAIAKEASFVTNVFHEEGRELKPNWRQYHETLVLAGDEWTQTDDVVCNTDDDVVYAKFIATNDPASVLRQVAGARKLLELHAVMEIPNREPVGNPVVRIDHAGREIRHWPEGSITGWHQVGTYYRCEHCESQDDYLPWPCPTIKLLAEMWGWTE